MKPLKTLDIVKIHENAFKYFGGYPEEAVYDQDTIILVSENHGDLIYTEEFGAYLQKRKFKVRMCRRVDPASKGKVEKIINTSHTISIIYQVRKDSTVPIQGNRYSRDVKYM